MKDMTNVEKRPYTCAKCGGHAGLPDEIRTTGGFWSKLFNIQNKKFITVSCAQCGYTELYKAETGSGDNVLDFLFGA